MFKSTFLAARIVLSVTLFCSFANNKPVNDNHPHIVNIINFIRLLEPRDSLITEDVLYQTVVKQVDIMRKYKLPGTFLLQYDALMDHRYQQLLTSLPKDSFEIGGWWEIPQPLVEKAGLKWRGRYPWDWHADVGFATGYTPSEREKLVDVYMANFKKIYGYYPKSVGSWFIDAHTLNYLYTKYHIVASTNCKDQLGTDGYTLWGGYWNQAYYPSKINTYMPAQNEINQTPVPIFRMLGSDPVRQYDDMGNGSNGQGVITLEPVYAFGGGDSAWVRWYFNQLTEGECMEFSYVQAGQENSFTWNAMAKGYEIQMPLIAKLRDENKLKVETLASSGEWFRNQYKLTPATAVTVNEDIKGSNRQTVWFNSRFYRLNILWENNSMRFRDIHLFDENFPSYYTNNVAKSNECTFFTLPFVDGYRWSTKTQSATLRVKAIKDGKEISIEGGKPEVNDDTKGLLHIEWPLTNFTGKLIMDMDEKELKITMDGNNNMSWFLDLAVADSIPLPFQKVRPQVIDCRFEKMNYKVKAIKGLFARTAGKRGIRIKPQMGTMVLNFQTNGRIVSL